MARKMNADNHAAYLDSTTTYTYDPADRLASSAKTGNGAGTETYVHDDNANVISQTVKGATTTYNYDRNRLLTATTGGTTANYTYDPYGRQETVTAGGKVIERSVYDGFDHVIDSQKADTTGALKSTTYTFDPLDRTTSKTTDGKTTDFAYLGLSSEVLDEKVAGALTKSYQYSPWGERLSQVKHNTDGTTEDGFYGYNSHTDVETLTDKNGDTKATYGYTAYGNDDKDQFTGIDKPDAADPTKEAYNPYRFNAKRWDAKSGTYDMGFRDYNPGLNRFTTRDMYTGALADMKLGADPYTSNRYAFTGGNPTSFIELDGHTSCDITGMCGGVYKETPLIRAEERPVVAPEMSKSSPPRLPVLPRFRLPGILGLLGGVEKKMDTEDALKRFAKPGNLTFHQWSNAVDQCQETAGLSISQCSELPKFIVDGKRTPEIAINDISAQAKGLPMLLTYNGGGRATRDANRELAGCKSAWKGPGSCDEYPFASTYEGGVGSQTRGVPVAEQRIQGGDLSGFYSSNKMISGDQFLVIVINVRFVNGQYVAP